MAFSSRTRLAGVIGHPVGHSLSPVLHNAAYAAMGVDAVYLAFDVTPRDLGVAVDSLRAFGGLGLSVTIPHKETVGSFLDNMSETADRLGAVNCVAVESGRLVGHNTDGEGFVGSIRHDAGIDVAGLECVVLGAGGAARAVVDALARAGAAEVIVVNRTRDRAEAVAALAGSNGRVGEASDISKASLIVNTTSLGLAVGDQPDVIPCDPGLLREGQVVFDLVYEPSQTPLLRAATERGAVAVNGLGMLVSQAACQIELWTGATAPVEVMWSAIRSREDVRR